MKKLFILIPLLFAGCASTDYVKYSETIVAVQTAKSNAEAEKYKAMAAIAKSGDTTAKVAAMMAMQNISQSSQVQVSTPKSTVDTIMQALGIFIPAIVQSYGIHANQQIQTTQSNNATILGVSTNQAFVGIAGKIQAPASNNYTTTTDIVSTTDTSTNSSYNPVGVK